MHAEFINSLLVALPLVLILFATVLRVDEHLFASDTRKKPAKPRHRFAVADEGGEVLLTDPDGRPFQSPRSRG
jgi:hypothetical protein